MRITQLPGSAYNYIIEVIDFTLPNQELRWHKVVRKKWKLLFALVKVLWLKVWKLKDHLSFTPYWQNK